MPFDGAFDDVYRLGIKEACAAADAYCERVDEQIFQERILDRIYNQIAKADLVIADMTGRNPNVFYEVGYAHALNKPAVLLTKHADDIPFDLKHFPHIVYGQSISTLRDDLIARVKWFKTNAPTNERGEFPIELYLNEHNLAKGNAVCTADPGYYPEVKLTIENRGNSTLGSGSFKIGVLCGDEFPDCAADGVRTIQLPTGQFLHILQPVEYLFPGEFARCSFVLQHRRVESNKRTDITIRVFTDAGVRDFPLAIQEQVQA
ncbi:MAG TPA: hypothetical protein VHC20_08325 [Candidatus Paceibacterota bacterium]|nr:hypothetical protein [Candidatus Paceibacterota bacterium]